MGWDILACTFLLTFCIGFLWQLHTLWQVYCIIWKMYSFISWETHASLTKHTDGCLRQSLFQTYMHLSIWSSMSRMQKNGRVSLKMQVKLFFSLSFFIFINFVVAFLSLSSAIPLPFPLDDIFFQWFWSLSYQRSCHVKTILLMPDSCSELHLLV